MASGPRVGTTPEHWGPVVVFLLIIGAMAFSIGGSWMLWDGLNNVVVDHTNPYYHFSEKTASQEITHGIIALSLGALCLIVFIILLLTKRKFLFPP